MTKVFDILLAPILLLVCLLTCSVIFGVRLVVYAIAWVFGHIPGGRVHDDGRAAPG